MPQLRCSQPEAVHRIANLQPFMASSMSAGWVEGQMRVDGNLTPPGRLFVIRSYVTPVALIVPGGSALVNTRHYSRTTAGHLTFIRRGLSLGGYTVHEYEGEPAQMFEPRRKEKVRSFGGYGPRTAGIISHGIRGVA